MCLDKKRCVGGGEGKGGLCSCRQRLKYCDHYVSINLNDKERQEECFEREREREREKREREREE